MDRYTKVSYGGHTLDSWTAQQAAQVKGLYVILGGTGSVSIEQGSYNKGGVSASAGTHDGGGAVDFGLSKPTKANWLILQHAVRWAMFAGWHRLPSQGPWGDHVHCILIGNIKAAPLAKAQVQDYVGTPPKNGLAGHYLDKSWHPSPIFTSTYGLADTSLSDLQKFANKKGGNLVPRYSVKRVQTALNLKAHSGLKVDGKFGPTTKSAYHHWQGLVKRGDNGVPGKADLWLLSAARFKVVA